MSVLLQPHRELLVDQVVSTVRKEIKAGRWRSWLPAERSLLKVFNVSRPTVRAALRQLVAARLLASVPRRGYRIVSRGTIPRPNKTSSVEIGLICPERIYSMPPYVIQVVDLLRAMCAESGLHLEILEGRRFSRTDPGRFMPQIVRSHPKACWIPVMADRRMQEWFSRTATPSVIYGNVYRDILLPSAGVDYRACIRHATSLLLTKGHRRIALITHDRRRAGEQASILGFEDAFRQHCGENLSPLVLSRPDDDAVSLRRQVDRLLQSRPRPSAIIVCRTHHYATVVTRVLECGLRIPADVSLICRGEDTFLHFLSPVPSFYRINLETLARTLFRCVLRVVGGATRPNEEHKLIPSLVGGESVGRPPIETAP